MAYCRVFLLAQFTGTIQELLPIYTASFMTTAATVSVNVATVINTVTKSILKTHRLSL